MLAFTIIHDYTTRLHQINLDGSFSWGILQPPSLFVGMWEAQDHFTKIRLCREETRKQNEDHGPDLIL